MNIQSNTKKLKLAVTRDEFFSLLQNWGWKDDQQIEKEWSQIFPLQQNLQNMHSKNPELTPYDESFRKMIDSQYSSGPPFFD
jgi:hypothetical protein